MWTEAVTEGSGGTYLELDVKPGSSSQGIKGYDEWKKRIKVAVKAEPRDGKANSELITVLGKFFGLPPRRIIIYSGQTSNLKRIFIEGFDINAAKDRLGEVLGSK